MASKAKTAKRAASLLKAMKDQGRSVAWLAKETGYSRGYVSNVLHGNVAWTEEFQQRALAALSTSATIPVQYRGRVISLPENIHKAAAGLPLIVVESAYEEAWKRAWLQENAPTTLAAAAERAWLIASQSAA